MTHTFSVPCPFCESEKLDVSISIARKGYGTNPSVYHACVFCKNCHMYGPRKLCYSDGRYGYSTEEYIEFCNTVIHKWNNKLF